MNDSREAAVLLVSEKSERSRKLAFILERYFSRIFQIVALEEIMTRSINNGEIQLIVVGEIAEKLDGDFFQALKGWFPQARIICLPGRISREKEITLRSSGIVFLGSFHYFAGHAQEILASALGREMRVHNVPE